MTTGHRSAAPLVKHSLSLLSAVSATTVALWLVPASVHIVRWPASGPVRVALLLPAWQLAASLAVATLIATVGIVWSATRVHASVAGDHHLARAARWAAPFALLWLWTVPYLPWIPDRLPLLLLLAGPLRWGIPLFIALVLLSRTARWQRLLASASTIGRRTVFVTGLVLYVSCGLASVRMNGLVGDEPHYLIIAESLLRDGDLQIENNHQARDYRSYFSGDLRPDFMQRGKNGAIYSIHALGLPAIAFPIYAVAGHLGVVALIGLFGALAALAIFDLAEILAGRPAALLTWLATCLTVPFIPYSWSIFPEMPGALLIAWAALWLWQSETTSRTTWLRRGAVLAAWPWLHTKFVVFLAIFAAAFCLRLWRSPRALTAFLSPIVVSLLAWFYSFYLIYGVFNPEAPYGGYADLYVVVDNIPHGLVGLFFDPKFGLFFYSPIYLASVAGAWLLFRRRGSRLAPLVLWSAVAVFVGSTARLYMFWGGSSAPARFLVPILPCLAPMVAVAIASARSAMARALVGVSIAVGVVIALISVVALNRLILFSDPHYGGARILEAIQGGSPLASVVPTLTNPDWQDHLGTLVLWLVAATVAVTTTALIARATAMTPWAAAASLSGVFLLVSAVFTARPAAHIRDETAQRGDIEILSRYDGDRFRTLAYDPLRRVSPDELRDLSSISVAPPTPVTERGELAGPLSLPPGLYQAKVWFSNARSRQGEVIVEAFRQTPFATLEGDLQNPALVDFELPVSVRRLMVRIPDVQLASTVLRVDIVPKVVVPPGSREPHPIRTVEAVHGRKGAFLAYTDEHAYPENGIFWSRGTAETTVMVAPAGASRITLELSTGPLAGEVVVSVAGEVRTVGMVAGQGNAVSFSLDPRQRLVPVTVQSRVMFRPGEVDSSSRDMRGLGCQVHVLLD